MPNPLMEANSLLPRASLAAVIIGALVAVLIDVAFGLLGAALGLNSLPLQQGMDTGHMAATLGLALVAGVLAFSAGGYIAGRLAPAESRWNSAVHGLAAYALALFSVSFLTGNSNFGSLVARAGVEAGMGNPELWVIPAAMREGLAIANFVTLGLYTAGAAAAVVGGLAGLRAEVLLRRRNRKVSVAVERARDQTRDQAA